MMIDGIKLLAPTGIMITFAILYFCMMTDAGLFNPLIQFIIKIVKGDPLKIVVGTGILGICVGLDGDGATTYIIVATALLPLYKNWNPPTSHGNSSITVNWGNEYFTLGWSIF